MKKKKKIVPIPDWKQAWHFASIQWSAVGVVVMSILEAVHQGWLALPSQVSERIPNAPILALCIYVLVMVGRVYKLTQDDDNDKPDKR